MAETRWSWETNIDTGIERMVTENYAFMGATQSMYLRSGNETRRVCDKTKLKILFILIRSFTTEK